MEQFALPEGTAFPKDVDPISIAKSCAHLFRNLDITNLHPGAAWYDLFALTGDVTSVKSRVAIATSWDHLLTIRGVSGFQVLDEGVQIRTYGGQIPAIEVPCTFSTGCDPKLQGVAAFSLVFCPKDRRSSNGWQVWMIRTRLDRLLKQRGDVDKLDPLTAHAPVLTPPIRNDFSSLRYGCVVVGAGQAGLAVAGRLKALGISYLAIDRNSRIGDNWLNRYNSVKLHTPREFSHLPYGRTFSGEYPEWLGKADIARGHNEWVQRYGINLSLSTELLSGQWDDRLKRWSLRVRQGGDLQTLTCDHIVLATGLGIRTPRIPTYAGSIIEILGRGQDNEQ
ncbi:indole-3-pyruvate monooxygenase YUCCA6 [Aspergillus udagawae]|uniref:Indole-3-pyruvate monooxygenase YUCCA6 n=1 Tax=Aspergillus udagawae TaxID=91492 RepID=A0A8H3SEF8_9EURO|nr:indole-3-pyruvate monooxygenase YUCCA6 [Aspergillus udagawae]